MATSVLQAIDLVRSDGSPMPGLVPVHGDDLTKASLPIDERVALNDAASFRGDDSAELIDYIFFRRFTDGRSSQIAAYVVDNGNERLDKTKLARLHLQVWLQGTAPLLYVAWPSRIDVLACARGADFWSEPKGRLQYNTAARLNLDMLSTAGAISEEMRRFSAFRLADGTFWEAPINKDLADYAKAAHQSLIQAVVEADEELDGANNPSLRRLLLLVILVKYLEDRRVFEQYEGNWFEQWHHGAKTFLDVLQRGKVAEVHALLESLEAKFNGDVFNISRSPEERITRRDLDTFAQFIGARTLNRQLYLWEQYSFEHIPVEIISHIYQRFVQSGHGAVYTPPFLAALLLDQAMPYPELTGRERVLDPACGSGVFLVGAFRRLVNVWRSRNNWKKPDVATLKTILKRSIHGVELEPFAVDLTAFSLSLAICDALKPDVIWNELKFDSLLDSNLAQGDYFEKVLESRKGKHNLLDDGFDVVVGNPPFESELTLAGKEVDRIAQEQGTNRHGLPDNQAAYLFLEQSLAVLCLRGRVCLIQPSQLFYYPSNREFRNEMFHGTQIDAILDFTSVCGLYEAAKSTKTIAVLARTKRSEVRQMIRHYTFRNTPTVQKRLCFELDHYDRHWVSREEMETLPYVWRENLMGGGRLRSLSSRFGKMRTMGKYIAEKDWDFGEGFAVGNKKKPASFLKGKPHLPSKALNAKGCDPAAIQPIIEDHFERPRDENRYLPPRILIRELDSLPLWFSEKGFLAYPNEIVGIGGRQANGKDLRLMFDALRERHRLYRFILVLRGSKALIARKSQISQADISALPFPEAAEQLDDLSFWEKALQNDVLKHMVQYSWGSERQHLTMNSAKQSDLRRYAELFVRMLGSVYDNLAFAAPVFLDGLICQPFYFGDRPDLSWLFGSRKEAAKHLRELIYEEDKHACLRTIRVLRFYMENVLLIVKPDRLRYWIRSTAIRDADETLMDLRRQGYYTWRLI